MRRPSFFRLVGTLAASSLVGLGFLFLGSTTPRINDGAAAEQAVTAAISDIADPFQMHLSDFSAGAFQASSQVPSLHSAVAGRLQAHFTGEALKRWDAAISEALDRQVAGGVTVSLGGGITTITFDKTVVAGASASSSGTVRTWGDYADPATGRVEHGTGYYSFQALLVRREGVWLVSEVNLSPVNQGDPE